MTTARSTGKLKQRSNDMLLHLWLSHRARTHEMSGTDVVEIAHFHNMQANRISYELLRRGMVIYWNDATGMYDTKPKRH